MMISIKGFSFISGSAMELHVPEMFFKEFTVLSIIPDGRMQVCRINSDSDKFTRLFIQAMY
jgi:hypothetical protein